MLHGNVQINHHQILEWRATNEGLLDPDTGLTCYEVNVDWTDQRGYRRHREFQLLHERGKGAAQLAAKILTESGA